MTVAPAHARRVGEYARLFLPVIELDGLRDELQRNKHAWCSSSWLELLTALRLLARPRLRRDRNASLLRLEHERVGRVTQVDARAPGQQVVDASLLLGVARTARALEHFYFPPFSLFMLSLTTVNLSTPGIVLPASQRSRAAFVLSDDVIRSKSPDFLTKASSFFLSPIVGTTSLTISTQTTLPAIPPACDLGSVSMMCWRSWDSNDTRGSSAFCAASRSSRIA